MWEELFDSHIKKIKKIKTDWTINDFTKSKFLGKGANGSVYLYIENKTGLEYAIKTIPITDKIIEDPSIVFRELIHQIIVSGHPNICSIIGTFRDGRNLMCVQDMCGTEMSKVDFKNVSTELKVKWIIELLSAVEHCHKLEILHLDIKLGNCLITNNAVLKLTDFGFSINLNKIPMRNIGTPNYIAPENYKFMHLSTASDIWSCGIVFVFMFQPSLFLQNTKISEITLKKLIKEIITHEVTIDDLHAIPDLYKPIVLEMLQYSWANRISATNALAKFKEVAAAAKAAKTAEAEATEAVEAAEAVEAVEATEAAEAK